MPEPGTLTGAMRTSNAIAFCRGVHTEMTAVSHAADEIITAIGNAWQWLNNWTWDGRAADAWMSGWRADYWKLQTLLWQLPAAQKHVMKQVAVAAAKVARRGSDHFQVTAPPPMTAISVLSDVGPPAKKPLPGGDTVSVDVNRLRDAAADLAVLADTLAKQAPVLTGALNFYGHDGLQVPSLAAALAKAQARAPGDAADMRARYRLALDLDRREDRMTVTIPWARKQVDNEIRALKAPPIPPSTTPPNWAWMSDGKYSLSTLASSHGTDVAHLLWLTLGAHSQDGILSQEKFNEFVDNVSWNAPIPAGVVIRFPGGPGEQEGWDWTSDGNYSLSEIAAGHNTKVADLLRETFGSYTQPDFNEHVNSAADWSAPVPGGLAVQIPGKAAAPATQPQQPHNAVGSGGHVPPTPPVTPAWPVLFAPWNDD